jgi:hypothetical protein
VKISFNFGVGRDGELRVAKVLRSLYFVAEMKSLGSETFWTSRAQAESGVCHEQMGEQGGAGRSREEQEGAGESRREQKQTEVSRERANTAQHASYLRRFHVISKLYPIGYVLTRSGCETSEGRTW